MTLPMPARPAITSERLSDPQALRQALGSYGTGVTVVTTHWQGEDWGLTCNSFAAVSLSPPLVLWSLGHRASCLEAFRQAGGFTVSVLGAGQEALGKRFASGTMAERFEGVALHRLAEGRSRVDGALAWFDCRTHQSLTAGDHDVFIGEITGFEAHGGDALSFWRSRFGRFS